MRGEMLFRPAFQHAKIARVASAKQTQKRAVSLVRAGPRRGEGEHDGSGARAIRFTG
jgi:hypothetical protein